MVEFKHTLIGSKRPNIAHKPSETVSIPATGFVTAPGVPLKPNLRDENGLIDGSNVPTNEEVDDDLIDSDEEEELRHCKAWCSQLLPQDRLLLGLPRNSYTAYRMFYGRPEYLDRSSQIMVIGPVNKRNIKAFTRPEPGADMDHLSHDDAQYEARVDHAATLLPKAVPNPLKHRNTFNPGFINHTILSKDKNNNIAVDDSVNDSFHFEPTGANMTPRSKAFQDINEAHLSELLSSTQQRPMAKPVDEGIAIPSSDTAPLLPSAEVRPQAHTFHGWSPGSLTHRHTRLGTEFYPFRHKHDESENETMSPLSPISFATLRRSSVTIPSPSQLRRAATINVKVPNLNLKRRATVHPPMEPNIPDYLFSPTVYDSQTPAKLPTARMDILQERMAADKGKQKQKEQKYNKTKNDISVPPEYDPDEYINKLYAGDASVSQYPVSTASSTSSSNQSYATARENFISESDNDNDYDDGLFESAYDVMGQTRPNSNLSKSSQGLFVTPTSLLNTSPIYAHPTVKSGSSELRGLLSAPGTSSLKGSSSLERSSSEGSISPLLRSSTPSSSETITKGNIFQRLKKSKTKTKNGSPSPELAVTPKSQDPQLGHVKFNISAPTTTHGVSSYTAKSPEVNISESDDSDDNNIIDQVAVGTAATIAAAAGVAQSMYDRSFEVLADGAYERLMRRWKSAKQFTRQQTRNRRRVEGGASQVWRYLGRKTPGEIIRIEKSLVLIKHSESQSLPAYFNDRETSTDTRVLERWKEYIVVARVTGNYDTPIVLQLYSNRKISAVESVMMEMDSNATKTKNGTLKPGGQTKRLNASRPKFTIHLNRHLLNVNLYSSLDKTVALWMAQPSEHGNEINLSDVEKRKRAESRERLGTVIYIFKGHTGLSSYKWLAFFSQILGQVRRSGVTVQVPDLGVYVDLKIPWDNLKSLEQVMKRMLSSEDDDDNQRVRSIGMNDVLHHYVMMKIVWTLHRTPEFRPTIEKWLREEKLGFCWKRYDRLEWVQKSYDYKEVRSSETMTRCYDLQLRVIKSSPTEVNYPSEEGTDNNNGMKMPEPTPIEGYLHRLTSTKGKSKNLWGKLHARLLYFSTHDNLLFFSRPSHVTPPLETQYKDDDYSNSALKNDNIQLIRPYRTTDDGRDIAWIRRLRKKDSQGLAKVIPYGPESEFRHRDKYALDNIHRRATQIVKADGFVNMEDILSVRPVQRQRYTTDAMIGHGSNQLHTMYSIPEEHDTYDLEEEEEINEYADNEVFEIVLKNKMIIRLQADNVECQRIWVTRLKELVEYWKRFMVEDLARKINLRLRNLSILGIKEDCYAQFGDSAQKWETSKADADPQLYNMDAISWSRSVAMKGLLYAKYNKHASFKQYYGVLCHGHLIIYSMHRRTALGISVPKVEYRKLRTIDLRGCYTYSGNIAQSDLLSLDSSIDRNDPGTHRVPKVYADGWRSSEEEINRCFVLWFGRKRAVTALSDRRNAHNQTSTKIKVVNRLGVLGNSMVFLTRARAERDLWVTTLNTEIEKVFEPDYDDVSIS